MTIKRYNQAFHEMAGCFMQEHAEGEYVKWEDVDRLLATPEGYVLVPVEPTKEMWDAWDSAPNNHEDDSVNVDCAYKAMLAAAPTPEEKP